MQNATLIIDNVQRSADQGTYTCIARNKHNYTSQRSVEVKVLGMYKHKSEMPLYLTSSNICSESIKYSFLLQISLTFNKLEGLTLRRVGKFP